MATESFFSNASLAYLASAGAGKDGKAYSIKPTDGTGDFTFSRGSNLAATRIGADGLIEKGRENLLLRSNDFSNATWTKTNSSVTSGQSGYDGSSDAWLLNKPTDGSISYFSQGSISLSGVWTNSVYAKKNTLNFIWFRSLGGSDVSCFFDLENGTTGTSNNTILTSIEAVGTGGWYRCSITANTSNNSFLIYPAQSNGNLTSGVGSVFLQDTQAEIGLAATDVISTGATTGKAGLLEDEPRFDYSGGATCPSLLLEGSRTQLFEQSEYFGGWSLNPSGISSIEPNYAISPEGVKNAYKVNFVVQGDSDLALVDGHSVTGGSTYAYSIYIKGEGSDIGKDIVVKSKRSGGDSAGTTTFQTLTDEWVRVDFTTTYAANNTAANFYISSNDATSCLIYGAQAEEGSYGTSYIPNHSGGSVTRGADDIDKLTGVGVTGDEFTIFLELDLSDTPLVSNVGTYFQTFDASNNSQQEFRFFTSNGEQVLVPYFRQDGAYSFGNGGNAVRFDGKILFRSDGGGNYAMFFGFNGSSTKEVRTGLTAYTLNKIDFISQPKTNLKQLLIFNEALSDADCTTLTT